MALIIYLKPSSSKFSSEVRVVNSTPGDGEQTSTFLVVKHDTKRERERRREEEEEKKKKRKQLTFRFPRAGHINKEELDEEPNELRGAGRGAKQGGKRARRGSRGRA